MDKWNQIGAGSCGTAPAPSAERQLDVARWVEQLGYVTERLSVLVFTLEDRLSPAMGEDAQNACRETPQTPACPMAEEIRYRVSALNEIEERIHSILRRLEF